MPHYSYEYTFEAGTSITEQEELEMPCAWGILTNVLIAFAAGCHGVVHVHLDESLHQIFPTNPNGQYAFDNVTVPIHDKYELLPATRKIYLRGWNEGTYDHTIRVSFEIEPAEPVSAVDKATLSIAELLKRVFKWRK